MPLVATEHDPSSRRRVFRVYVQNGVLGLVVLLAFTWFRFDDAAATFEALGSDGPLLAALFFFFALTLALLKFPLTDQIYVSLVITAYISMFPLLGLVASAWIAVLAAVTPRLLGMLQIGPSKVDMSDAPLEWARTFALFATYGTPVIIATVCWENLGGVAPQLEPGAGAAGRIAICGVILILMNNLIVARVEQAYGYSRGMSVKLAIIDSSICMISLPYAILTTLAYGAIGWGGILASAFTGIIANSVGRKLATTRSDRERLIQRLASLTNIGKTISLSWSMDELLMTIYTECRNVIDVSLFSIALYDSSSKELRFELSVDQGRVEPKTRIPVGEGLNSWVLLNGKPLLIGSAREERKLGISAYDDGVKTESWLGVPMVARDQVIGVVSVQSFAKDAFSHADEVLLTAIANQAAVAIENANLYKDLETLNIALESRVAERTIELRETNLRLTAADRSKNQFLASMSHELRTPLNAIIGFSAILLDSTEKVLPARLFRFLQNIRTAGNHLLELINDILDLAKIESGKLQLDLDAVDPRETIGTVERVMKGIAAERRISIVTQIDPDIGIVHLDEGRLKQILLNLLSNAVKFSGDGSFVHLTVSAVPAEQSVLHRDEITFVVTDSGIGIPPDELNHIFDQFYQVQQRARKQHGGTGLGLSLTRSFVEMHGGRIEVTSEPGNGSTFTIRLPRDCRPIASAAAAAEPKRRSEEMTGH